MHLPGHFRIYCCYNHTRWTGAGNVLLVMSTASEIISFLTLFQVHKRAKRSTTLVKLLFVCRLLKNLLDVATKSLTWVEMHAVTIDALFSAKR